MITVITKGKVVQVEPDLQNEKDILEVAQALIEVYGWNNTKKDAYTPSSEKQGYTLHDAIGEAGVRISADPGVANGTKDAFGLRQQAIELVEAHTPMRQGVRLSDQQANDAARDAAQIIRILEKARAA
jgi:hypothetical protein